ncbi:peptide ABC transporter substrate-binding protein [Indioceanicola profundi]|uniref:peptide ABC transporter substrate-binding protein n=1 Tax=Indioceanicola profundi TaxID=2220096 RepID=UPI001CED425F|nr:peptide ABC transporter substrate-binding protein [Indioceanicola profundi]
MQTVMSRFSPKALRSGILAAGALALLALAGCGEQEATTEQASAAPPPAAADGIVLRRGNGAEPETLDPHKSTGVPESWIQYDLFEGLMVPDGKGGLIPGAAESTEISDDQLTYTFHLRPDGKWSDGTPVTAHDFVFAWKRLVDPKTASDYAYFLWPVENGEDITLGRQPVDNLAVEAVDDLTFRVKLRAPTPYFTSMLHHHATYPINKAAYETHGDNFVRPGNYVGNGAYMLAEAVPQSHVKLVKNPHFHAKDEVQIDTVYYYVTEQLEAELRRFRAGELDVTYEVPVSQMDWVQANMPQNLRLAPYFGTYFYAPNMTHEPWKSNKDLRLALNLAIDRDVIVRDINKQGQIPAYGWVPPGTTNYENQAPEYAAWTQEQRDAKAKELIQQAGYGPGGQPLEVEILYNTSENHRKLAIAVAAMWQQKLGAKVTLNNQEWKVFLDSRDEKKFKDVTRHGWIGDYNDANNFLELFRTDIGKQNPSGYSNPEFDKLMIEANRTEDVERRAELMQQAERIVIEDVALFPLYFYASKHMISDRVENWNDNLPDYHPTRFLRIKQ